MCHEDPVVFSNGAKTVGEWKFDVKVHTRWAQKTSVISRGPKKHH